MEHLLAALAVWILWTILGIVVTTPEWSPYALGIALGLGFQLLIDPGDWYLGLGIGGAAGFLVLACVAAFALALLRWLMATNVNWKRSWRRSEIVGERVAKRAA